MKTENDSQLKIGLALSGGGSRAIAFHLGCMKALHEKGILEKVNVISSVSGGAIIGAIYAYSDDSFEEFEKKIKKLLKKGLFWAILRSFLIKFDRIKAFERVLDKKYFKEKKITDTTKKDVDIVINSTELRTGTAFRFGKKISGSWKIGEIVDNNSIKISTAVVASSAYPIFLPSVDLKTKFKQNNESRDKRVLLSDGGIYENTGISAFYPDKKNSYNNHLVDVIISCNAGYGALDGDDSQTNIYTRTKRSIDVLMKKNQDEVNSKLFNYKKDGQIKMFALAYLGMNDKEIEDSVTENRITKQQAKYKTTFNAMPENYINIISGRGEALTRVFIEKYLSDLI